MPQVNKKYKDTVFRHLFSDKEKLLELYNAVNGTTYTDPNRLVINTLENAIYMKFKNDISFVFAMELYLFEHQSTINPNIPLRDLFYVSSLLQGMVAKKDLYRSTRVRIPTPRFLVFYNGIQKQPEAMEYRLSDLFECPAETPELELTVRVLNINEGNNAAVVHASRTLHDYVRFVSIVRENLKTMPVEEAVRNAIDTCIRKGILADYLRKHRAEVEAMSIFEYDEEQHLNTVHEEGVIEGFERGRQEGLKEGQEKGRQEERENTEQERRRADAAEKRAETLEMRVAELEKLITEMQASSTEIS